jgi:predicted transcriptional regulator
MAVSKMLSNKFNSLPVVGENGTAIGILTSTDILWSYQRMVESMQVTLQQNGLIEFPLSD